MVFKNCCVLVLWTKVASALEGLNCLACFNFTHKMPGEGYADIFSVTLVCYKIPLSYLIKYLSSP